MARWNWCSVQKAPAAADSASVSESDVTDEDLLSLSDSDDAAARTNKQDTEERVVDLGLSTEPLKGGSQSMGQSAEALLEELQSLWVDIQQAIIGIEYDELVMTRCACRRKGMMRRVRCYDCARIDVMCEECLKEQHRLCPFHRPEKWNGYFFERTDLSALDYVFHLGHRGYPCPSVAKERVHTVTIGHVNGIHEARIGYCDCAGKDNDVIQLMKHGIFPASASHPKTAFTHGVLRAFHTDANVSKKSGYDFINSLEKMTSNAVPTSSIYHQFMRVAHFWDVLCAERWSGQAFHFDDERLGRPTGSYAIPCLACPIPGFNTGNTLSDSFVNARFYIVDANFHLIGLRKNDKNNQFEKPMWDGRGYMQKQEDVEAHLQKFGDVKEEKSDCSDFLAIQNALVTKQLKYKGQYASGQVAVLCRHGLVVPQGVVNLQQGERHINVDLAFSGALESARGVPRINLCYDINCQYSKNIVKRFEACFPQQAHIIRDLVNFYIGTFHVVGHKTSCQYGYSLCYAEGTGRTDGEDVERYWSEMNQVAASTKQMTPGHRSDTLDDFVAGWNWAKLLKMCDALYDAHRKAVKEAHSHAIAFHEFNKKIRQAFPQQACIWDKLDTSPKREPNGEWTSVYKLKPKAVKSLQYNAKTLGVSKRPRQGVRLEDLIYNAIKIEQRQLKMRLNSGAFDDSHRNALRLDIKEWEEQRSAIMPQVKPTSVVPESSKVDSFKLCLPSTFTDQQRHDLGLTNVAKAEYKLREAQAHDALSNLKNEICEFEQIDKIKKRLTHGPSNMTRSAHARDTAASLKRLYKLEYQEAREALLKLGMDEKDETFRPLKEEDMYREVIGEPHELGSGSKTIGWIWTIGWENLDLNQLSRSEEENRVRWFRARATKERWREQVELLEEECKRFIKGLEAWAGLWSDCGEQISKKSGGCCSGASAYTKRKSALYNVMACYARSKAIVSDEKARSVSLERGRGSSVAGCDQPTKPVEAIKRSPKRRKRKDDKDVEIAKRARTEERGWGT